MLEISTFRYWRCILRLFHPLSQSNVCVENKIGAKSENEWVAQLRYVKWCKSFGFCLSHFKLRFKLRCAHANSNHRLLVRWFLLVLSLFPFKDKRRFWIKTGACFIFSLFWLVSYKQSDNFSKVTKSLALYKMHTNPMQFNWMAWANFTSFIRCHCTFGAIYFGFSLSVYFSCLIYHLSSEVKVNAIAV